MIVKLHIHSSKGWPNQSVSHQPIHSKDIIIKPPLNFKLHWTKRSPKTYRSLLTVDSDNTIWNAKWTPVEVGNILVEARRETQRMNTDLIEISNDNTHISCQNDRNTWAPTTTICGSWMASVPIVLNTSWSLLITGISCSMYNKILVLQVISKHMIFLYFRCFDRTSPLCARMDSVTASHRWLVRADGPGDGYEKWRGWGTLTDQASLPLGAPGLGC